MENQLNTDADYKAALREVSAYFDSEPEPGTADGDRFEALLALIAAYEATHADAVTAVDHMRSFMQTRKPEIKIDLKALINDGRE